MPNNAHRPTDRTNTPRRAKRRYSAALPQPTRSRQRHPRLHVFVGVALLLAAAVLVVTHQMEHAGVIDPLPGTLEDLFIGFPTAALVGIGGFIALIWR